MKKRQTLACLLAAAFAPSTLARQLDAFTKDPEIQKQLDALGLLIDGSGPQAFKMSLPLNSIPSIRAR